MNKPAVITAEVDAETLAMVEALAGAKGVSSGQFAAEAIRRFAEVETDFRAFVQVGIDAADRGELVPHEDVMAELEARIERRRRQCEK
jgi:predicted transcriptional regulator